MAGVEEVGGGIEGKLQVVMKGLGVEGSKGLRWYVAVVGRVGVSSIYEREWG